MLYSLDAMCDNQVLKRERPQNNPKTTRERVQRERDQYMHIKCSDSRRQRGARMSFDGGPVFGGRP